jgi:hypothetical protein
LRNVSEIRQPALPATRVPIEQISRSSQRLFADMSVSVTRGPLIVGTGTFVTPPRVPETYESETFALHALKPSAGR